MWSMIAVSPNVETDAKALKGRSGIARIANAFCYSLAGLKAAYCGEAAFRQLLLLNLVLIPVACTMEVTRSERVLLIVAPLISLIVELVNSAIEATVDRVGLERHTLSKRAKDIGSASVLISLLNVLAVWSCILAGKLS